MKQKTTVLLKAKKVQLTVSALIALAFAYPAQAQNTSYSANTLSIGGTSNCAFGVSVLGSTTGAQNAGVGRLALSSNTSGRDNAAIGYYALFSNTTGGYNTAAGSYALQANTTGRYNAAFGYQALQGNTAENNTSIGFRSMYINTTGTNNTASGFAALYSNSTASENVANGFSALYSNTTGGGNMAIGSKALYSNTVGNDNVASGFLALYSNTSGEGNVATGFSALYATTTGGANTAAGFHALSHNTIGWGNVADGHYALFSSVSGENNLATGNFALAGNTTGNSNSATGYFALYTNTSGNANTGAGSYADVSTGALTNATALGNGAIVNASDKVRIGNASVTVIEGQVAYSYPSDGRFKTNVKEQDVKGLEFIKKLRPVVYNLDTRKLTEFQTKHMPDSIRKHHLAQDFAISTKIRQSGFIAQEVEKAAKDAQYDFNGVHVPANPEEENYSIAYSEFVVPLVKAVQEQQKIIETLQQQVNDLLENQKSPTSLDQTSAITASMEQNVPNPFSQETVIKFNLPQQVSNATMNVYDLSGKQLKSLPINQRGSASLTITADQLAAGMYIYSIVADGKILSSKRMVVAGK